MGVVRGNGIGDAGVEHCPSGVHPSCVVQELSGCYADGGLVSRNSHRAGIGDAYNGYLAGMVGLAVAFHPGNLSAGYCFRALQDSEAPSNGWYGASVDAHPVLREEILHAGRKVDVSKVPGLWVINPEGKQELFLAISLRCVHCKEQFFKIYKAMEKGELKDYRIKIAISPSQQESKVIEALAATAIHESMEKAMELLAAWYETQNRKLFLLSVKKNLPTKGVKEALEAINESVEALGVEGLPFVVLDGYEITPTIFWAKVEWEG